ncbi:hypothetical protein BSS2_II0493 [Brucella suis bv. 1 str. S2]|nr:hypothetical protein BRA0517 [Brucella suis 1330]ABQ62656.1 hypothetical protein BOV_A0450 [Brucella ovis ATCC 25840]ACU49644.1 hypothetical protein BMI_II512 [Brucella microti CCM 4915]ADZ67741.1 conserved hypothetical protein [Brucella melitensis M28]ADZ88608.1 conserved hypothetical protein [Brucella melitensis M5-90]AEK55942.1 hypothetical protein BPI_II499 [Brucella pinnipedialis B2/94]AEQ10193.1 hypothetical protein BMNI_II0483 [Brucella melitensis NI]AEU07657.1 hypothetical protein
MFSLDRIRLHETVPNFIFTHIQPESGVSVAISPVRAHFDLDE